MNGASVLNVWQICWCNQDLFVDKVWPLKNKLDTESIPSKNKSNWHCEEGSYLQLLIFIAPWTLCHNPPQMANNFLWTVAITFQLSQEICHICTEERNWSLNPGMIVVIKNYSSPIWNSFLNQLKRKAMGRGGARDEASEIKVLLFLFVLAAGTLYLGWSFVMKELLESIAKTTGGMHVMVHNMDELSTFFRRQVLLSRFIAQTAHGEFRNEYIRLL